MLILRFNQKLFSGFDDYYRKNRNQIQENNYNDLINGSQDDNVKKRAKNLYKDNNICTDNFQQNQRPMFKIIPKTENRRHKMRHPDKKT